MEENIVKSTCKTLGITQKELADRMGVHVQTMSQWARGINAIPEWGTRFMSVLVELENNKADQDTIKEAIHILQSALK